MGVGARYWQQRLRRWPRRPAQEKGYTLLMPVPGDLPVFLEIALAVCRLQSPGHRVATCVIPDQVTPAIGEVTARAARSWPGPLKVQPLPVPERFFLPKLHNPSHNYGMQILTGVARARSSYVILHDADLFLTDPGTHDRRFEAATAQSLDVLGADGAWDGWFAEHGRHLAATWEMTARTDWFRSFPPAKHFGHDEVLDGEMHNFDVTFFTQCHTDPARIAVIPGAEDFVHFNYSIGTYRQFQRRTGVFEDKKFRLVLIRVLIDLFADVAYDYVVPTMAELEKALAAPTADVSFATADPAEYRLLRDGIDRIVAGPWAEGRRDRAADLSAFDRAFGWSPRAVDR